MSKQLAIKFISDTIKSDIKLGWGLYLVDAPISNESKISQLQDMMQCWQAKNLQELLNNMCKGAC